MLEKILTFFFKETIADIKKSAIFLGQDQERTYRERERQKSLIFIGELFIGKNVFYVTNEWQDMVFATIESVEIVGGTVMVAGEEFFTKERIYLHPQSLYLAQETVVEAFLKLNPLQRWCVSSRKGINTPMYGIEGPIQALTNPAALLAELRAAKFFER